MGPEFTKFSKVLSRDLPELPSAYLTRLAASITSKFQRVAWGMISLLWVIPKFSVPFRLLCC